MREWVISNTSITPEDYDKIMCYQDNPEKCIIKPNLETKKLILRSLEEFSLKPVNFWRMKKYRVIKDNGWYVFFKIPFKLMADYMDDDKLYSFERYGKCYGSYFIALRNKLDIVLAIVQSEGNYECMHSFLVGLIDNVEVVFDYTLNLILRKEDYYDLLNVKEITYLKYQELVDLDNLLSSSEINNKDIYVHELLCFPKEIREEVLKLQKIKK